MRKLMLVAVLMLSLDPVVAVANCTTQTFIVNGKVMICTTCCYGVNCTTTCY